MSKPGKKTPRSTMPGVNPKKAAKPKARKSAAVRTSSSQKSDPPWSGEIKEYLNPDFGFFYRAAPPKVRLQTEFQKLEIVESEEFGKVLLLDGVTQVVTANEWMYHEPMVHPAMLLHPHPEEVVVIGGGDGGMAREVLKHPSVKTLWQVDIDGAVYEFSAKHLPQVSQGSLHHPKTRRVVQDGRAFLEAHPGAFDVVLMDMTDPFGPAKFLYTLEFFEIVRRSFRDPLAGVFAMHAESPISRPRTFKSILGTLQKAFQKVSPLHLYMQMYAVQWCVAVASDTFALKDLSVDVVDRRIQERRLGALQLIEGATVQAMGVEAPWLRILRAERAKILRDENPDVEDVIHPTGGR